MSKPESLIGLAAKAGKLTFGFADTCEAIDKGKIFLVLISRDAAERTVKNTKFEADKKGVRVMQTETDGSILASLCGRPGALSVIGVCDRSFSRGMIE